MKSPPNSPNPDPRALYLDLMKRSLINWIYGDQELASILPKRFFTRKVVAACRSRNIRMVVPRPFDPALRFEGRDWPPTAHSMIGRRRLDNLQFCVEDIHRNSVKGDLIETGVWRGGASILMRAILKVHGVTDRLVWVADSFEGLPPPDTENYPQDAGNQLYLASELAVTLDQVKANFDRYGLLDEQVRFLKGWFRDTLPDAPVERLAVMRLDGDLYESTMNALVHLYPKLSIGGYAIVDDYGAIDACRQAVEDYRKSNGITDEIVRVDWTGVYWRRS
jgi:O-methyltransferase